MIYGLWKKKRSQFNHDWLKNIYIPNVATYINILDNKIEDDDFVENFLTNIFKGFELHIHDAVSLIDEFIDEMSPRVLFNEQPLIRLDEDVREIFSDIIHKLWCDKYFVYKRIYQIRKLINNTIIAYKRILDIGFSNNINLNVKSFSIYKPLFLEFLFTCRELSKAIEKIPSDIKMV